MTVPFALCLLGGNDRHGSTGLGAREGHASASGYSFLSTRAVTSRALSIPSNDRVPIHLQTTWASVGVSYLVEQFFHCDLLRLSLVTVELYSAVLVAADDVLVSGMDCQPDLASCPRGPPDLLRG